MYRKNFIGGNVADIITSISDFLWSQYVLIPLLLITGLYFTIRTRGLQIRLLPDMCRSITEKNTSENEKSISPFQAFAVGLASRVGTGNLSGVAIAICVGGPGAVFWMWVVAILGSVSAFVESTLAQLYKVRDEEVEFRGGPAYYMRDGIKSKAMGIGFAVLISLCFGLIFNAVQANTLASALAHSFGVVEASRQTFTIFVGFVLAALTGYVLFGGTKRIAEMSSVIVPVMATLYIILAAIVIVMRFGEIPHVFSMIFEDAFDFNSAIGGAIGTTIIMGVKRGLFSNEAGMGSAPNAAASASTEHPASQGLIQSLGVYIDTLIICTATAFIILVSDVPIDPSQTDGISVTMMALSSVVGNWANTFLTIAIFFFVFSSILGNYYYAQSNLEFIKESPVFINIFKVILLITVFLGAVGSSAVVWTLADIFMALMAILNIVAILMLSPQAMTLLKDYEKQKKAGKKPVFNANEYEEFKDFEIWKR